MPYQPLILTEADILAEALAREEWARGQAELDELQALDPAEAEAEYRSALPFTDEPIEEAIPFAVQIDGHKLAPILAYDDAGIWLDILAIHFPGSDIGIVLT